MKRLIIALIALCLTAAFALPAQALDSCPSDISPKDVRIHKADPETGEVVIYWDLPGIFKENTYFRTSIVKTIIYVSAENGPATKAIVNEAVDSYRLCNLSGYKYTIRVVYSLFNCMEVEGEPVTIDLKTRRSQDGSSADPECDDSMPICPPDDPKCTVTN